MRHKNVEMLTVCRKSETPSQQVDKEKTLLFGINRKTPYLCIRFKIHTLVRVSFLIHICIRLVLVSDFLFCPFD